MRIQYIRQWQLISVILCVLLSNTLHAEAAPPPIYYVYLAGPEVFLPEPVKAGELKKAAIKKLNDKHKWPFTLVGLYPMDNEIPNFKPDRDTGLVIYRANIALMDKAHFVAANMVRFRSPSMDVGTAFEMGYMRGLNKPVFGYYESKPFYGKVEKPGIYAERAKKHYYIDKNKTGVDIHGQSIEDFQMSDNLMMIGALDDAGGKIHLTFDEVIMSIAKYIQASRATMK